MENIKDSIDNIANHIIKICNIPSPSGYTSELLDYMESYFKQLGYKTEITIKKSLIVDLGGQNNPIAFAAHIDTLGAMVRSVQSNGKLQLTKIGGYPEVNIEGENCIIHTRSGKKFSGTFYMKNPGVHINKSLGETKRDDKNIEVVIDEIVNNKEDVKKLGIAPGDFISIDPRATATTSGYIKSRHLDDKASASILMELAHFLKKMKISLSRKVYLVFTSYEEVGHGASAGLPLEIKDLVSVDMGVIGEDLETTEHKVSICAKDSSGPYDYELTNSLIETARKLELNYAVDIYPFYGSDASASLVAGYNVRHGLIGPGVYASHGYERTHKEGLENTFRLLLDYVQI